MRLVLQVYHKGEYKMVGKLFLAEWPKGHERLILLHEESGSQGHHNLSAPGGIDTVLREDLMNWDVDQIHHYNRKEKILFTTGVHNFLLHGQRQKSGGRDRIYLPERYWHHEYQQASLPYRVPWIKDVKQYGGPLEGIQIGLPGMENIDAPATSTRRRGDPADAGPRRRQ